MIAYRNGPPGAPFFWETGDQPAARWSAFGDGPTQYMATTPDAAWAEFLRHAEISDPDEIPSVRRTLWAVEVPDDEPFAQPALDLSLLTGRPVTHEDCQAEGRRLRSAGATGLRAPSAAIFPGNSGYRVDGGLVPAQPMTDETLVLFGRRPDIRGWRACEAGYPNVVLLDRVRR